MGGDKVVSEIYAATLIDLRCSFYFLVTVGRPLCHAPGGHRVGVLYVPNPGPSRIGLSRETYVISRRPLDIYEELASDLAPRTCTQRAWTE